MSISIDPTPHDLNCPAWCVSDHAGDTGLPRSEVLHASRASRFHTRDSGDVEVQLSQAGSDPADALVFMVVNRFDVLHVPAADARRIGEALISAADDVDVDVDEKLAQEGIVVESTPTGVSVTFAMTDAERRRFKALLEQSWQDVVADLLRNRQGTR